MFSNFKLLIKIIKKIGKKYSIEIFLLICALIITFISLILYFKENSSIEKEEAIFKEEAFKSKNQTSNKIYVDIAGAVEKPDVYEVAFGVRLKDVLNKAGGLSSEADRGFFYRNFNLAKIVNDQEKIYIPSTYEINNGFFNESTRTLDYTQPSRQTVLGKLTESNSNENQLININTAEMEELDTLPGVGKITAQKIIQNRPYNLIEDLLNKKIVGKSTFEKIKNLISL